MAYNWEWKHKMGEIFYDKWHYNLYEGNGIMIAIDEFKMSKDRRTVDDTAEDGEDCYRVCWAFTDKAHMKRCLGLEKGSYDMFEGNVDRIILYADECHHLMDIIKAFQKAEPHIVIEIYSTRPKEVA